MRRHFLQAVFEQRVPPGARLTEEALAETFGVSRTVIRQVIARLVQDGILIKQATGATNVAAPTRSETKKMLTVRHMIEPEIVRSLATRSGSLSFDALKSHLDKEDQARAARDRATLSRGKMVADLVGQDITEKAALSHFFIRPEGAVQVISGEIE